MSWTVKPSRTQEITKRTEPYLSDEAKAKYEKDLIPRYPERRGALLPILHDLQHHERCIPHQAMVEVAQFLNLTPGEVLDTVSFYEEFHVEPVGRHVVAVCQSVACEACGHAAVLDHLKDKLGIDEHETTADGKVTLLALECLGACEKAPCMLRNDELIGPLTPDQAARLVDELE
ncbi:MAG: NAD(P)H-dependent oxidoreductase subunit E [Planctomycetota bacterium]|jgi:NADH:ubiquinone oxidoreductase subunit E|nr:NAD(P)H-dependent oxidoreductase subunit E [Planctomycetota bacterium]MEC7196612.1 NAD(P)H-dependent oxidoreductase subunit E [Planctomycetota bacterium]MEC8102054.1 NAD(P)H-dependent oxidoreductase subunit E [Planctomycetota bacterium]MEC8115472.1 NAD(P)H-dependent oxidoreductase subunit E [Planctomycetota bacterium]